VRIATRCQALFLALLLCAGCSRDRSVSLTLDFGRAPGGLWRYALDASVKGTVSATETGRRGFTSAAQCTLMCTADAKNPAVFHASVTGASFTSNILAGAEIENLVSQSREVRFTCDTRNAAIAPDDSATMPMIRIGEWDIFTDLAKALPALPKIRVRPGASWDREKTIPLDTRYGGAAGHVLQSFRLDSVSAGPGGKRIAHVGWKFTYRVERRGANVDAAAAILLDRVPPKGDGAGTATINVDDKTLESASMSFSVPDGSEGTYRISWSETISLTRVY
jgi:hypothetical protein